MLERQLILRSLDRLLRRAPLRRIYLCGRRTAPPLCSYVVNFPRLEIPLSGRYEMEIELDGQPTLIAPGPGTAVFAAPNCWNNPTWSRPVQLMSILFGKKQTGVSLVTADGGPARGCAPRSWPAAPAHGARGEDPVGLARIAGARDTVWAYPELIRALLVSVRALVAGPLAGRKSRGRGLMEEVCIYLQQNYPRAITRDSTAASSGSRPTTSHASSRPRA